MGTLLHSTLGHAARGFGQCAKLVKAKAAPSGFTIPESERIIGIGIAADWVRWAQLLQSIKYSIRKRSTSDREHGLNELTRFTFMWIATNALFSRSAIIELLNPSAGSKRPELDRFRVLYQNCSLPPADATRFESTLHSLLALQTNVQYFPWRPGSARPTVLEIIYYKYTASRHQSLGLGKMLLQAITSRSYNHLDLPTLIYATRNWNIHGVILASSFRGPTHRFYTWIDTINIALAKVLEGIAMALQKAI